MQTLRQALSRMWTNLNPSEPSPLFLAKLMGTAIVLFAIGLAVGHA